MKQAYVYIPIGTMLSAKDTNMYYKTECRWLTVKVINSLMSSDQFLP